MEGKRIKNKTVAKASPVHRSRNMV